MELLTQVDRSSLDQPPYRGRLLIDGAFCEAQSGKRADRLSPAHGVVVGSYPDADEADVNRAVAAARRAFEGGDWPQWTGRQRSELLLRVAAGIERRLEPMARQEALESGKPLAQARDEVAGCVDLWRYAAALARTLHGESYNSLGESMLGVVLRQPVGVVALVTPWNFPLWILSQKLP